MLLKIVSDLSNELLDLGKKAVDIAYNIVK